MGQSGGSQSAIREVRRGLRMGCSVWYEGTSYKSQIRVEFESRHHLFWVRHRITLIAEPNTMDDEVRKRELRKDVVTKRRLGLLRKLNNFEVVVANTTYRCHTGEDVNIRAETRVEWDTLGLGRGYHDAFFDCKVYEDGHPIVMEFGGDKREEPPSSRSEAGVAQPGGA